MNRLFISTKEAYIPDAEITHAQYVADEGNFVELFNCHDEPVGTIATSSPAESIWFTKSIFVNLNIKDPLIMDYTQKRIIHTTSVSIPLVQVPLEEEMETQEAFSSISHLELEEK